MDKHVSVMNDLHKINISTVVTPNVPLEGSSLVQDIPAPAPTPAVSKQLSEAMLRRVADYRTSRRDLSVRTAETLAWLDHEISESWRKVQELTPKREQLAKIAEELGKPSPLDTDGTASQSVIAAESRKLDDLRLDVCRMITESGVPASVSETTTRIPTRGASQASSSLDLDSLTFGQLCRLGWGVFFPVVIAVFLAALLIGAAVVAAFNGSIRW